MVVAEATLRILRVRRLGGLAVGRAVAQKAERGAADLSKVAAEIARLARYEERAISRQRTVLQQLGVRLLVAE